MEGSRARRIVRKEAIDSWSIARPNILSIMASYLDDSKQFDRPLDDASTKGSIDRSINRWGGGSGSDWGVVVLSSCHRIGANSWWCSRCLLFWFASFSPSSCVFDAVVAFECKSNARKIPIQSLHLSGNQSLILWRPPRLQFGGCDCCSC